MGVERKVLKGGTGAKPQQGQTVTVHCTGYLADGRRKFWSTKDQGQCHYIFSLGMGQVIRGWDEGVAQMQAGEVCELLVSGEHGYGAAGFEAWGIGPNASLLFEVELVSVASS